MMETNFCRQVVKEFGAAVSVPPHIGQMYGNDLAPLWNAVDLIQRARKFVLPYTGRLLDDRQYRALDEGEPLRLPFPVIALEYFADLSKDCADGTRSTKRIVLAQEDGDSIVVTPIIWMDSEKAWAPMPQCALPSTAFLDRSQVSRDGYVAIRAQFADPRIPMEDYADELGALLGFLNALQCSNVKIERVPRKKEKANLKQGLPFDTYHVLTIETNRQAGKTAPPSDADRRSPREHLRRGHIRRLETGRKVWVNAAVVNAGKPGGKITKDYAVR
jgi:hypothetical protein